VGKNPGKKQHSSVESAEPTRRKAGRRTRLGPNEKVPKAEKKESIMQSIRVTCKASRAKNLADSDTAGLHGKAAENDKKNDVRHSKWKVPPVGPGRSAQTVGRTPKSLASIKTLLFAETGDAEAG